MVTCPGESCRAYWPRGLVVGFFGCVRVYWFGGVCVPPTDRQPQLGLFNQKQKRGRASEGFSAALLVLRLKSNQGWSVLLQEKRSSLEAPA